MVDDFEIALLDAAVATGTPVLAICRGLQVLNVAMGGSLDQHLPDQDGLIPHGVPNGGEGATHEISAAAGSRLASALGADVAYGRSHHHQAVARVGDGLVVTATAPDGVVEGLELDGSTWCVAVQWHPEETAATDATQQRLFDSLVAQATA
jgi:gamma-glutamyl-gamma-aminobutyrate hydrolase PuuD